jgi:hypothetical protein
MKKSRTREFAWMAVSAAFVGAILWCSGCGFVSIFGTPTRHEKKIPAEYDLAQHKVEKILVLVNQPGWLKAQSNLRQGLTSTLNEGLEARVGFVPERLVTYDELWKWRSARGDFSQLSPVETGAALGADLVLFVTIEAFELERTADTRYYKGLLGVRAALYNTATKENLWPRTNSGKRVVVGFDVERRGPEVAVSRLVGGAARCTIRYLFDCPVAEFDISDDRSTLNW